MTAIAILERQACGANGCPCQRAARNGKGLTHCIVHRDPNPSMKVDENAEGRVLVHCNASCEQGAVIAALRDANLWDEEPARDINPVPFRREPARQTGSGREPVAIYRYATHDGEALEKARFENGGHKRFTWRRAGDTGWPGIDPIKLSEVALWGADLVAQAEPDAPVWICEGEKATEACRARGLLAVTFAGGSGSKDFGKAFECLKGHPVYLWPDNDASGRKYGSYLKAHLEAMGIRVRPITVAVPETGDAHDFFAAGGQVEDLLQRVPAQPVLEFLSEDALRVRMNTVLGLVAVTCADIVKTNRSLDAQVTVQVLSPTERDAVSDRCDLQSLWKTSGLIKTLNQLHQIGSDPKDLSGWTETLLKAFGMIREGFLNHDPSMDVSAIEATEGEQEHVSELLAALEANVIFGDGSAGKTGLCQNIITCCAAGEPFLGLETMPGPWLFVDYEATPSNFKRRIRRMVKAFGMDDIPPGLIHYWAARGTPIPDLIPALQKKIREKGIVGIVVDSAVAACGGDPVAPDVVIRYFNSLAKLGITSITIAHITKGGDTEKPFGSGFWHHMPRRTWYVERVQHEGSDVIDLALFNRKINDGPKHAPIGVSMFFDGRDGEIRVLRSDLRDVPEFDTKRPLLDRLREGLASGAHPIYALAERTGADTDAIRKCLQRYEGKHFVRINDSRGGPGNKTYWGLRDDESEGTARVAGIPF